MKLRYALIIVLSLLQTGISHAQKVEAAAIYFNGFIYTGGNQRERTEAIAVGRDGKILLTGSSKDIKDQFSAPVMVDLKGKPVYPGFIDAHCHFSGYALDAYKCDLTRTRSFEEVLTRLQTYERQNSLSWIYGRGWDQNDWTMQEFPTKEKLDELFPNKPVVLKRVDGHAILCNQKALDQAGITAATKIEGGIVTLKDGKPTGLLIDNAMEAVENIIPELPERQALEYLKTMEKTCYASGLTFMVECGVTNRTLDILQKAYNNKDLGIGLNAMLANEPLTIENYLSKGPLKGGQFSITAIKVYSDGALGSRGACLLADYSDQPGHRGMMLTSAADMKKICEQALKYGWQVATHAIGDSANRVVLRTYASVLPKENANRWRIEHAQVVDPADYPYFRMYGIIPSVQPTHATSDMPWAEKRLGKSRIRNAYAYRQLQQLTGILPLGTDFPVEAINPLGTFYAAVTRKDAAGNPKEGFFADQALSREDALKGMTSWAAASVFKEQEKGTIEPGKDADFVVLDKDIMVIPESELLTAKVQMTVCRGKVEYQAGK